mgnify:CR=1 FL=1
MTSDLPLRDSAAALGRTDLTPLIDAVALQPEARRLRDAILLANGFELEIVTCDDPRLAQALVFWLEGAIRTDKVG